MKKRFVITTFLSMLICLCTSAGAMEADILGGVEIHGFISQGYLNSSEYNFLAHNSKEGSFEYDEMGINFSKQITDKLRISTQLFARDLGNVANNKIKLDYAYADYHWQDWLGIRIGKIRIPYGYWNEIRDFDMLRPWIVLPQPLCDELTRDLFVGLNGGGLYGDIPIGLAGSVEYFMAAGSINVDPDDGTGKIQSDSFKGLLSSNDSPDIDTALIGNVKWNTPLPGLMLGYWALKLKSDSDITISAYNIETTLLFDAITDGVMLEYTWNNLTLWAEYVRLDQDTELTGLTETTNLKTSRYYIGGAYRFADWFQLGSYYIVGYGDDDDKDGKDLEAQGIPAHRAWQKDLAVTFRFDINDSWVFKVEGHSVDGTYRVIEIDNEGSDFEEQDWYYGAVKLTFSF